MRWLWLVAALLALAALGRALARRLGRPVDDGGGDVNRSGVPPEHFFH
jgi:hypothetical protein